MNERELADAERMLNDARVRTKPKITIARAGMQVMGVVALTAVLTVAFGVSGALLGLIIASFAFINALKDVEPARDLRLQPEGVADVTNPGRPVRLLPYAEIDAVAWEGSIVALRSGEQTLQLEVGNSGLVSLLHRYLEAHVRAAHALADERRVATDFLVRVDAPDYRHAGPPASALEAIARAKGMPLALRVEAARAIDLAEEEIGVTEELKQSMAMFDE